jgi:hypothetical protein
MLSAPARPVEWISFTVPQARNDEDFFAPLRDLQVGHREILETQPSPA